MKTEEKKHLAVSLDTSGTRKYVVIPLQRPDTLTPKIRSKPVNKEGLSRGLRDGSRCCTCLEMGSDRRSKLLKQSPQLILYLGRTQRTGVPIDKHGVPSHSVYDWEFILGIKADIQDKDRHMKTRESKKEASRNNSFTQTQEGYRPTTVGTVQN